MKLYSENHILHQLHFQLASLTQKDLAKKLGVSPQYLADVLKGRRQITDRIANKLGYQKVVAFTNLKKADRQ